MKMHIEVTDTFGGEANYAWVRRKTVEVPEKITRRSVVQRAKKEMGWTGERCKMHDYSEAIELWLAGAHIVMFITFGE
jgi:hypothetical protein